MTEVELQVERLVIVVEENLPLGQLA